MSGNEGLQFPSAEALGVRWEAAHPEEQYGWLGLRVRRATSWLSRAEAEMRDEPGDPDAAQQFFVKVCRLDRERVVYDAIWSRFSGPIRLLLDNPYVYKWYWMDRNKPGGGGWQARFAARKERMHRALAQQDTYVILCEMFERLYVLRNQLVHGGATWNSRANRDQVKDGQAILATLVPHFISIMIANHEADWGRPHFPPEYVADG
ncbi:MAG: hypothetical protein J4G06_10110 [Caldilineaceae bacterium]|nr:hypothetical protein [Caldilineaceae bacterium]